MNKNNFFYQLDIILANKQTHLSHLQTIARQEEGTMASPATPLEISKTLREMSLLKDIKSKANNMEFVNGKETINKLKTDIKNKIESADSEMEMAKSYRDWIGFDSARNRKKDSEKDLKTLESLQTSELTSIGSDNNNSKEPEDFGSSDFGGFDEF